MTKESEQIFIVIGIFQTAYVAVNIENLAAYLKRLCDNSTIKAVCEIEGIELILFRG